jgi:hypothetical protein
MDVRVGGDLKNLRVDPQKRPHERRDLRMPRVRIAGSLFA